MPASDDLALLADAARAAGEIALRHWKKSPEVWDKGNGEGPVSEADLAVNRMLEAELRAARPAYGWLSEESPDRHSHLGSRRSFVIDPIDGTRAFLEGSADFSHALAVVDSGRVIAATVFLPARNSLYSAESDGISTLNGKAIGCAPERAADGARVLTARGNLAPHHWRDGAKPDLVPLFRASLALRLCLVADGTVDGLLTLRPAWEWDIAAGSLIAERAGARVSDRHGRTLAFSTAEPLLDGVLAAPPGLHRELAARLAA